MTRRVWEVDVDIIGPISITESISFKQEKGFDQDQFYSNIRLNNSKRGICSTVTAYADNSDIAKTAAFVFMGRMVDVLSLDNDLPLILSTHEEIANHLRKSPIRRSLNKTDFIAAFNVARRLEITDPILLKAIGWYSKGKISINTLDKFLSYWNVIEITASEYHTETERTQNGMINKVYQCFLDYFGLANVWEFPERWINDMYDKRNRIVHGAEETTAQAISAVAELIPLLESISRKLIYAVLKSQYNWNIFEEATWYASSMQENTEKQEKYHGR